MPQLFQMLLYKIRDQLPRHWNNTSSNFNCQSKHCWPIQYRPYFMGRRLKNHKNLMGGKYQFVRKSLISIQSEHRLDISKSFTLKIVALFSRNRLHLHCKQFKQLETLHSTYRSLSAALNLDKDVYNSAHPGSYHFGFHSAVESITRA